MVGHRGVDARAVVGDGQHDVAALPPDGDADAGIAPVGDRVERVLEEVDEDLFETNAAGDDR